MRLRALLLTAVLLAGSSSIHADGTGTFNLRDLLTDFLRDGITLADPATAGFPSHSAHFIAVDSPQFQALQSFSSSVATQLSSFPLASSAGGFTYTFDPALGVFTRASDSFGPVYAERSSTIGKGKFNLGINHSHFAFDSFDDLNLRDGDIKLVFTHLDANDDGSSLSPFFEGDVITADLFLKVESDITAFVMTYGVSDRLDIGAAIPLIDVSLESQAEVAIQRVGSGTGSSIHTFKNGTTSEVLRQEGSAAGVGDVLLRGKFRVLETPRGGLALGADLRLPTGEERDLLGTGATQVKGFLIGSLRAGSFSPHVNAGYGVSSSAGDVEIPDEISYVAGFDWAIHPRMTFAFDVLGRNFLDTRVAEVRDTEFQANTNPSGPPNIVTATFPRLFSNAEDSDTMTGSIGVKVNPVGNVLITINGLFGIGDRGLQSSFSPTIGLDYSF